jgi:hypothetical protein
MYTIITIVAAAWVGLSAAFGFANAPFVVKNFTAYGVPRSWWPWLATAKAAGAVGLLVGLFVPVVGLLAGIALVLYFVGAVVTVVRARVYSHIPGPVLFLGIVAAALALNVAT